MTKKTRMTKKAKMRFISVHQCASVSVVVAVIIHRMSVIAAHPRVPLLSLSRAADRPSTPPSFHIVTATYNVKMKKKYLVRSEIMRNYEG